MSLWWEDSAPCDQGKFVIRTGLDLPSLNEPTMKDTCLIGILNLDINIEAPLEDRFYCTVRDGFISAQVLDSDTSTEITHLARKPIPYMHFFRHYKYRYLDISGSFLWHILRHVYRDVFISVFRCQYGDVIKGVRNVCLLNQQTWLWPLNLNSRSHLAGISGLLPSKSLTWTDQTSECQTSRKLSLVWHIV